MAELLETGLSSGLAVLGVVIAFSLLIFVHELGHFLAALLVGVRVEKFMLGFDAWGLGLRKRIRGTEYGVGLLPLGGYVKLAGASDLPGEEQATGAPDELMSKGVGARALVFVAGVAMNLVLGFAILVGAHLYGVPRPVNVLGVVREGGPAARAGLETGDRITAVDGEPIEWFKDLSEAVVLSEGEPLRLTVRRPGRDGPFDVRVYPAPGPGRIPWQIGVLPSRSRKVSGLIEDLPGLEGTAEQEALSELRARIRPGDRIVAVGETRIEHDYAGARIGELVRDRAGQTVTLTVQSPRTQDDAQEASAQKEGAWGPERAVEVQVYPAGVYPQAGMRFGLQVTEALEGFPAQAAGLRAGDRLGAVNGRYFRVPGIEPLQEALTEAALKPVEVTVRRQGRERTVTVQPKPMTGDPRLPPGGDNFLGVTLRSREPGEPFVVDAVLRDQSVPGRSGQDSGEGTADSLSPRERAGVRDVARVDRARDQDASLVSPLDSLPEAGGTGTGLQPGDVLLAVDGKPLANTEFLADQVDRASARPVRLLFLREDEERTVTLRPHVDPTVGTARIGVMLNAQRTLFGVEPASPAEDLHLGRGDEITGFELSPDLSSTRVAWRPRGGRGDENSARIPTPRPVRAHPSAHNVQGFLPLSLAGHYARRQAPTVWAGVKRGGAEAVDMALTVYRVFRRLVTGRLEPTAAGGPVMIFQVMYRTAEQGWDHLIDLVALISINLAIINLLPIPVLDGGHLLFLFIEWIKGSRPNPRAVEIAQYIGFACLIGLMLMVTAFDVYFGWLSPGP